MTGLDVLKLAAVAARAAVATPSETSSDHAYQEGFADGLWNAVELLQEAEAAR